MTPERKSHLQAVCQPILHTLQDRCSGLLWASVSTRDGIEVTSIGDSSNYKLSVMTSTMHALADGIVYEAALGACRSIVLDAQAGRVVVLSVPDGDDRLVLAGMARPDTSLGMLMACSTCACEDIGHAAAPPTPDAAPPKAGSWTSLAVNS